MKQLLAILMCAPLLAGAATTVKMSDLPAQTNVPNAMRLRSYDAALSGTNVDGTVAVSNLARYVMTNRLGLSNVSTLLWSNAADANVGIAAVPGFSGAFPGQVLRSSNNFGEIQWWDGSAWNGTIWIPGHITLGSSNKTGSSQHNVLNNTGNNVMQFYQFNTNAYGAIGFGMATPSLSEFCAIGYGPNLHHHAFSNAYILENSAARRMNIVLTGGGGTIDGGTALDTNHVLMMFDRVTAGGQLVGRTGLLMLTNDAVGPTNLMFDHLSGNLHFNGLAGSSFFSARSEVTNLVSVAAFSSTLPITNLLLTNVVYTNTLAGDVDLELTFAHAAASRGILMASNVTEGWHKQGEQGFASATTNTLYTRLKGTNHWYLTNISGITGLYYRQTP